MSKEKPTPMAIIEDLIVVAKTESAILVRHADEKEYKAWIPLSQLQHQSTIDATSDHGDTGSIVIPKWLAEKKELIWEEI